MPTAQHPRLRLRLPWRFSLFLLLCLSPLALATLMPLHFALMAGFDLAALIFLASLAPLFHHDEAGMRAHARANDANRIAMLLITGIVMLIILVVVASELTQRHTTPSVVVLALILSTLALTWIFVNTVYALHYAYLYYRADARQRDSRGIDFPGDKAPDYWDFVYFAFTLGMTFQTSDVSLSDRGVRKTVTFHCLAAFLFNLGIIAFTINVLGAN